MAVRIQNKRDAAATWTTNGTVVLLAGEIGFETDTGKFKIGDGTTIWTSLPYAAALPGDAYTDEKAQDAVGGMVADTNSIDLTYTDGTPALTADLKVDATPGNVALSVGAGGVSANVSGTIDCGSSTI